MGLWPDAIFDPADINAEGPFEVSFSSAGTKTIRLSLSNDGVNFEGPAEVQVQVNALPTATMSGDNEICFGSSTPIQVQVTGQTPWRLEYTDGTDVFTVFLSNPSPIFNVSPSSSRTYELVSIRDANQCFGTLSGSANIQVSASSIVTLEAGQAQADENNVAVVPVSVSGFENYTGMQFTVAWDPGQLDFQGTGNFGIPGLSEAANLGTVNTESGFLTFSWNTSNASDTTIADGTILLEITFSIQSSGCTSAEVSIDASGSAPVVAEVYSELPCTRVPAIINGSVGDLPEPPLFALNPVEICREDDIPAITAIGENIRWYADRDKSILVFTGNEFTPDNALVNPALPGTYWLYASQTPDACPQESALDSVAIVVLPGPENVVFSASETSVCPESEIIFTVEPADFANYQFVLNGAEAQSGASATFTAAQWNDGDQIFAVVSDALGCTFTTDVIEIEVLELDVSIQVTEISQCGAADGVLSAQVSGGSGDYTFTWSGPGISNPSLELQTGLIAGAYSVLVVDNVSGCTGMAEILLENPVPFTINLVGRQDVSSFGGSDGTISIEIIPAGTYTLQWTGPSDFSASTTSIENLTAGRYVANVSDGLCIDSLIVFINQPIPGIIISSVKTDVSTCGATDGTIDLTVTGGSGSFSYLWQGPNNFTSSQPDLNNLAAGLYFVTVTDLETALVQQHVVQINAPTDFVVDAQVNNVGACAGAEDGSIVLNISGGQGPFAFVWSSMDDPEFSGSGSQVSNLPVGEYGVTITDTGTGCSRSVLLNVALPAICDQPCSFLAAVASNPTTCPDSTRGNSIIFIINGGSGPGNYEYSMDDGESFEPFNGESVANIASLGQGSYVIIVRDRVTSCTSTVVANVGVSSSLAAVVNRSNPGCENDDGAITFDVFGISPFEVTLIDAEGNESVQNGNRFFEFGGLSAGAYYYNVKESGQFGCVIEAGDSVRLSVDCPGFICDDLEVEVRDLQDATCFDEPNGSAIFDVSGGNNPYQYSLDGENWTTFISGNRVSNLTPNGVYNILIRQSEEFNFCNATISVEINGPEAIIMNPPVVLVSNADCNVNNGIVRIGEISGGTGPYSYELDGTGIEFPAEGLLENLRAGQRILTVTDSLGCVKDFTFNVPSPGSVVATVTPIPVSCTSIQLKAGVEIQVDLVNTLVSGPYQAQIIALDGFNPTDTTIAIPDLGRRTLLGLDKGSYQVFVRSATGEGCSFEEFINLDEGPSPVDFDVLNQDQIVSCAGEPGSITLHNIRGDINEMFIILLLDLQGNVLETFERRYAEIETHFIIDGRITSQLVSGQYQVRMVQNQTDCQGISKTSGVINIREPLGELGFEVIDDALSFVDRPTGRIRGEIISSGGEPFFALIQLKEPAQRLNVNDVIDFNNNQRWRQVVNSAANATRFLVTFDSLWAGLYEIFIRDEYGCEIVIEYYLGYDERLFIPNVITPNNDGINDTFFIRNMPHEGTEVIITNRWGKVVFSSKSYSEDALWDGGDEADGIFYYKVKVPTGEVYTGWLEVWRGARP
jgi:gliding motility-associated-like protein